jgi:hypothetical protein
VKIVHALDCVATVIGDLQVVTATTVVPKITST